MSFGKAKRFPYSSDYTEKSANKSRGKERCASINTEESTRSTKYTIYFPPDSMPVRSPFLCKTRRRIDTKLYHRNKFNDSEYFVDEDGNITQEEDAPSKEASTASLGDEEETMLAGSFVTFDEFQSGLDGLRRDLGGGSDVGRMVDDVLEKVRVDGEEKIRGFAESFAEWNVAVVKEVKEKMKSLIDDVKATSGDEVKELTSMLLKRLEEAEASNGVHEERLRTLDEKVERQAVVINALACVIQSLQQWLKHNK